MKKRREPACDNPIIAALRRAFPVGGSVPFDVDRPPDHVLDLSAAFVFNDATIREFGLLVAKALLTGDRQIVTIVEDALKESDHTFRRDLVPVLRTDVIKYLPELTGSGMSIVEIKSEIEKRSNNSKKLDQHTWTRLRKGLSLTTLPTGAQAEAYGQERRKSGTKRA
jgi:hypothetical protein